MRTRLLFKDARLALAKAIWPKDVAEGDWFTVVRHLRVDGTPTSDGSWVGDPLLAEIVDGDRIAFTPEFCHRHHWLSPGVDCVVRPIHGRAPVVPELAKK